MGIDENVIGTEIVNSSYEIYNGLGSGLFESVYSRILTYELRSKGMKVESEVVVPVIWKGEDMGEGFRADLIVEDKVLSELKAVENLHKMHRRQTTNNLILCHHKLGYLINFGAVESKTLIKRIVNNL